MHLPTVPLHLVNTEVPQLQTLLLRPEIHRHVAGEVVAGLVHATRLQDEDLKVWEQRECGGKSVR